MFKEEFRFPDPVERPRRSTMNVFQHNITGNNMMMQEHECQKYTELSNELLCEFNCATEMERQIAQKIIDTNFRLNRLASIENNMLNFDMMTRETDSNPDDRTEVMFAQTRAWKDEAKSFDVLGRYEARLTRQILLYKKELERLQAMENRVVEYESASFGKTPAPLYVMRAAASTDVRPPAAPQDTRLSAASSVQPDYSTGVTPESASFGETLPLERPPLPPPTRLRLREFDRAERIHF